MWCLKSGDIFKDYTIEGVPLYFQVMDNYGDLTCQVEGTAWTNNYSGPLTIPGEVRGLRVVKIADYALRESGLTSITIPGSVSLIGQFALNNNKNLSKVTLMSGIKTIGTYAFGNCGFSSITIPESVESVGYGAFYNCKNLSVVNLMPGLKSIGSFAFGKCAVIGITIPKSVESISHNAFNSETIESIIVDNNNKTYDSRNNCNAVIRTNDNTLITGCKTTIIPLGVTSIGTFAFYSCPGLKSIVIPKSVKSIDTSAFDSCYELSNIIFSEGLQTLGYGAFWGCKELKRIDLPNSLKSIGANAFTACVGLSNVIIPNKVESIGEQAFYGCPISTITIPSSVTSIGQRAFASCNSLSAIIVNDSNKIYDSRDGCNAIIKTSDNTLETGCKNTIIPSSVVSIGSFSFAYCSSLNSIIIPENIKRIGDYAFYNCNNTKSVYIYSQEPPACGLSAFQNISNEAFLHVPFGTKHLYNTSYEGYFKNIVDDIHSIIITSSGNGELIFNGHTLRNSTKSFALYETSPNEITIIPDNGYRVKTVMDNGSNVTGNVIGNHYIVNSIQKNTTVAVEFEPIPPKTYTLTISATGNGSAMYSGTTIRSKANTFTVNEGTNATISLSPDSGYRIKSVKVGNVDVTANVSGNSYTIGNIQSNTTVAVEFEAIPPTTYTLTISATGNGYASYNKTEIRSKTNTFTVNEGTNAMISFTPDNDNHIEMVKVNGTDVTTGIVNGQYTISSIMADTSVEVVFAENIKAFACQGVNYTVISYEGKTVSLASGNYGKSLEIPAKVNYQDTEWTVTGLDADALRNNEELAAVIWHPDVAFMATVSNPNLLLYVNSGSHAPASIKNVVVGNVAKNIELVEAASGNSFYCPQEFKAQYISYSHNFNMTTGIGEAKGWETIALPFDVQRVMHENKGELVSFSMWKSGDEAKPFWLMQLESDGWKDADIIKAYIPYIISMPNNEGYKTEFLLNGKVTFSAENIVVRKTEVETSASYKGRTFVPTFSEVGMGDGAYALNVSNDYEMNVSGVTDGSRFVLNLRRVHPFEAYMKTSSAKTRAIDISDGMGVTDSDDEQEIIRIYNLKGQMMKTEQKKSVEEMKCSLPAGVYIINGKKMMVK